MLSIVLSYLASQVLVHTRKEVLMKGLTILGIVLIVFGLFLMVSQGISYTKNEKVLDIGPIEAHKETRKTIPVSPVAGGLAMVGGIVLVIAGSKK